MHIKLDQVGASVLKCAFPMMGRVICSLDNVGFPENEWLIHFFLDMKMWLYGIASSASQSHAVFLKKEKTSHLLIKSKDKNANQIEAIVLLSFLHMNKEKKLIKCDLKS